MFRESRIFECFAYQEDDYSQPQISFLDLCLWRSIYVMLTTNAPLAAAASQSNAVYKTLCIRENMKIPKIALVDTRCHKQTQA